MSNKNQSSSNYLNSVKEQQEGDQDKIKVDRTYVEPQEFQSKEPKKDDQVFFVSRLNKPAKYTKKSNFISYLIYRIGKDDASGLAAQMTYHFVLALFPMLIFLLTLLPFFQIDPQQIKDLVSQNAPSETADVVSRIFEDITKNSSGSLLSVGLLLAIWSASNGMSAIMNSFNVAYDVEDARNPVVLKILSVVFTIVMGIVLALALTLPTFGDFIKEHLFGPLGLSNEVAWIFDLVRIVLPFIVILILFLTLYSVAPNVKTKFKSVFPGALFTSIIWLVGSFAFGWYLSNFGNYSKTYGSLAGIIILLLWLYITCFIIIIGAEINAIVHQRHVIKGQTPEEAALVHDDNNQNHYNEDTTYEYKRTQPGKDEDYNIDKDDDDNNAEEKESLTDKIKDKFTSNNDNEDNKKS
ncbi:YihY/virulence factor BrkB family protein [Staphylococcus caledonicus]|uniref:YihY/virulence factor BrkB family protein n=1 Tax=Staphylococcus sp. acrmy TaxID=2929076 RepID=UPI001F592AAF|nr:YihY/virulence factor BrkB family protein [Staphylococcus sp. acrmy]MCI2948543.1 YihY/virulence factor BrkB family protein [Staphylococcus sp. acrmy]